MVKVRPDADLRLTLRDLASILGLVAVAAAFAGFLMWRQIAAQPRLRVAESRPLDSLAVTRAQHDTLWRTLPLHLPPDLVFSTSTGHLEVIEMQPPTSVQGWAARMALLDLTREADARFQAASYNCGLSEGRCWVDSAGTTAILCQRPGGARDPELSWAPLLECQVPARGVRMVANGPTSRLREFEELFRQAVPGP